MSDNAGKVQNSKAGRFGLALFILYVIVLALAAVSELFNLGWFDNPVFK